MSAKTRRFIPRLECFDERALPSVTYDLEGTVLFVHGDAAANQITVTDDGTSTGLTVTSNDGNNFNGTKDTPISQVFVDTQGGNDTVTYNLTNTLQVSRLVNADLGKGSDCFTANIANQSLAAWANLDLSGYGGGGGDSLVVNAQNVNTAPNSILNVYLSGDAGKDNLAFNYSVGVDGEQGTVIFKKDQKH